MKNFHLVFIVSLILSACGSPTPLERGRLITNQQKGTTLPESAVDPVANDLDLSFFNESVLPALENKCSSCHDNPAPNFERAKSLVMFKDINSSSLYLYATGLRGSHKKVLSSANPELAVLIAWINGAANTPVAPSKPAPAPAPTPALDEALFNQKVLGVLESRCGRCHDNPYPDYSSAVKMVKVGNPEESELFMYATGQGKKHRSVLKAGTPDYELVKSWILGAK